MILLDTNVISETMRAAPDARVMTWLHRQPPHDLGMPVVVLAELHYGAERLDEGRRKEGYRVALRHVAEVVFSGRVVPFDTEAARLFGVLMASRHRAGRPMGIADGQIAAIALANNARLATRDGDFADCGIEIINPWTLS